MPKMQKESKAAFAWLYDYFRDGRFLEEYAPLPKGIGPARYTLITLRSALKSRPSKRHLRFIQRMIVESGKKLNRRPRPPGQFPRMDVEYAMDDLLKLTANGWLGDYRSNNEVITLRMLHLRGVLYEIALGAKESSYFHRCLRFYMAGWWPAGCEGDARGGKILVAR